ncbi:glutamate carboxypeptidase 2 [Elysia marginata]|uniref:Glutamate carboxypeptidase 2 n=1 Tax=Elysia marginata TaxID=1093978 RepID=A0AAV4J4Z8_9GAST|nr:glutamate carboxypeptidase 2 [Elysia marginata]
MMRGFDSIESMNADSVLVKRQRGSKRFVVCAVIIGCAFFLVGILIGYFSRAHHHHPDATSTPAPFRQYTTESSVAGTPQAEGFAHKILSRWKSSDLDHAYISKHTIPVFLPNQSHPNKVELFDTISGETVHAAQLQEPPLRPDDTNSGDSLGFLPSSPSGEVNADVVYANYGRLKDFEYLKKNLSLDISGKIMIIRLGRIYAANKVFNAQQFGASAVILYPDPAEFSPSTQVQAQLTHSDDEASNPTNPSKPPNPSSSTVNRSTMENHGYPERWWIPPTGVRREPLYLMSREEKTPKIPCVSISFEDAAYILRNLSGPVSPTSWHGGLSVDYTTGPGFLHQDNSTELQVRVTVTNLIEARPLHNVIGVIYGSEEPDRYILVGHHHDTIVKGTVGDHAGSAALDQLVSVFGQLNKLGHKPLRTIIFCSWDGAEQGNLGLTAWLQENFQLVTERAVAYLDIGVMVEGNFTLHAVASPLLQGALYDAAKKSSDSNDDDDEDDDYDNDGDDDDDSCPFFSQQEELPTETYPLYHTSYDSIYAFENFCDPGYKFTKALTHMWGALILPLKQRIYNDQMMNLERVFIDTTGLTDRPKLKHVVFGTSIFDEATGVAFPGIQDALHKIRRRDTTETWAQLKREINKVTEHIRMAAKSLEKDPQL